MSQVRQVALGSLVGLPRIATAWAASTALGGPACPACWALSLPGRRHGGRLVPSGLNTQLTPPTHAQGLLFLSFCLAAAFLLRHLAIAVHLVPEPRRWAVWAPSRRLWQRALRSTAAMWSTRPMSRCAGYQLSMCYICDDWVAQQTICDCMVSNERWSPAKGSGRLCSLVAPGASRAPGVVADGRRTFFIEILTTKLFFCSQRSPNGTRPSCHGRSWFMLQQHGPMLQQHSLLPPSNTTR